MSELFDAIHREVCSGECLKDFMLGIFLGYWADPKSFLWGHAIEEARPLPPKGKPYFIRLGWGEYCINPEHWNCAWPQTRF